ncbi:hypothetical protein Cgig2_015742 [Carnegiea gigantea]|uniref:Uncharacterized protein n=1 Tax=Carnegiea gigantea TaxID=171969 RepID=A0A9Q1Q4E6_9CARY|nr:hypothetical protein Cgig2_015742 [Carnegiea gigantea]
MPDSSSPLPRPGTDNPLQATLIHTYLHDHELEEIATVVFQMDGPAEIPNKVKLLKEEGNKCFKHNDFASASAYYLSGITLLCFTYIISYEDEILFRNLAVTLILAASELKQGKFRSMRTLCSLFLEFQPNNTKALFRRATAALGLHDIRQLVSDLKEATQIEPNNYEVTKELARIESKGSRVDTHNRESKSPDQEGNYVEKGLSGVTASVQ